MLLQKKKPIKVLHLIPSLSSGGAERQLVNLVCNTDKRSIEHIVCILHDVDFFTSQIRSNGHRVIQLKINSRKHPFVQGMHRFRRVIREECPDIVHSWLYDANIVSRISLFPFNKTPIVTSWQLADYDPHGIAGAGWNPTKVAGLKFLDKFTAWLTNPYFVACSEFVKKSYAQDYGFEGSGVQTIYNAVDPHLLESSNPDDSINIAKNLGIPDDSFVFLNVARLDPQKNQRMLLDAFRNVTLSISNAYLLIVGSGEIKNELISHAQTLGISDRVLFLGQRKDVGELLEFSDIFVFPSLFEGLPLALIEAMYKSKPCIVSRIGVFEEIIVDHKNGLLVDPHSASELSDAMIKLCNNMELRKNIGKLGFETARNSFDAVSTAGQWEDLYYRIKSKVNG